MIRRLILASLMVLALLGAVGVPNVLPASAATPNAGVTVSPPAGSQNETFTFTGQGFDPGEAITVQFVSPDGVDTYSLKRDGVDVPVIAGDDGTWILTVSPATDFAGSAAGAWTAKFSIADGTYWSGTFEISIQ